MNSYIIHRDNVVARKKNKSQLDKKRCPVFSFHIFVAAERWQKKELIFKLWKRKLQCISRFKSFADFIESQYPL